ncbi:MAG: hypothetical protein ACYCUI_09295, partial [Vulcanimicrobiaceae bacterium]
TTLHFELPQPDAVRATLANPAGKPSLTLTTVMGYEIRGQGHSLMSVDPTPAAYAKNLAETRLQ